MAATRTFLLGSLLTLLTVFLPNAFAGPMPNVHFKTRDGWTITAVYHHPTKGKPICILIHGLGSSQDEWGDFSSKLWKLGLGTLAINLRGHGNSLDGPHGKTDFSHFDETNEWPNMINDLLAARVFLNHRGVSDSRIIFIGASIGANLAAQASVQIKQSPWLILLSPGQNYHGIGLEIPTNKPLLLGASPVDGYAYATCAQIINAVHGPNFLQAQAGHGVQMFKDPQFTQKLLTWITERIAAK